MNFDVGKRSTGIGQFSCNPLLLFLEQVDGDCSGQVCLEKLPTLLFEVQDPFAVTLDPSLN